MLKIFFLLFSTGLLIFHFNDRLFFNIDVNPIQHRVGNPFGEPLLLNNGDKGDRYQGYKITALASYNIYARVLSKKEYHSDPESELSNYDLALGWDKMTKNEVLKNIEITQDDRRYYGRTEGDPLISLQEIKTMSANTHIIASNDKVYETLAQVKKDDFVSIQGYLVNIEGLMTWKSSLTRNDDGEGACEIMWVTNISIN